MSTLEQNESRQLEGVDPWRPEERVLERDGYACRVCEASGCRKRSIVVHHRAPGRSILNLMISLCPTCHAKVGRTRVVLRAMSPLLLELWREQHPTGHKQTVSDFRVKYIVPRSIPLFRPDIASDSDVTLAKLKQLYLEPED